MLRNTIIVLVVAAVSATATFAATRRHASVSTHSAGVHRHAAAPTHSAARGSRPTAYHIPSRYRYAGLHHPTLHTTPYLSSRHRFRYHAAYTPRSYAPRRFDSLPLPAATAATLSIPTRRFTPMPGPLRGSFESLARQNQMAEEEGLERILDEGDLVDRIERHELVPLPASASLLVNGSLPEAHRYCRPWTARFLSDFAGAHAARFDRPMLVSSAVRTVEYQKRLQRINGNAAAAEGDIVSPHLTGATIDIAKGTMSRQEVGWVRAWLMPLQAAGKLDVEEEFQQACFHITVYKTYAPALESPGPRRRRPAVDPEVASRGH